MSAPVDSAHGRHWTSLLRCPVCLSYFHEPVTLDCGHTFCYRCMQRIARILIAKNQVSGVVGMHRLRMWCPECRHCVPAQMFLQNTATISFVIRDLVEGWRNERHNLTKSGQIMVRSTSSQTNSADLELSKYDRVSKDEWFLKPRPDIQYIQAAVQSVDSDTACGYTNDNHMSRVRGSNSESTIEDIYEPHTFAAAAAAADDDDDGESDGGDSQDEDDPQQREHVVDWTLGRMLLAVAWATYTFVIMILAQTYVPYMFLYTILFMLIIYTERLPHRRRILAL